MTEYTFKPTDELVEFARMFADNYKLLSDSRYTSTYNNYCIDYLFGMTKKDGTKENVFFRVLPNGKMEANKALIYKNEKITGNFVFFMLMWCTIHYECRRAYMEVDKICMEYYLSLGLPKDELLKGFTEVTLVTVGQTNAPRLNALRELLSNENKGKDN